MNLQLEHQEATAVIDGYIIGIESGEVYGLEGQKEEFTVNSESAAEWVLEKISEAEGRVVGLRAELSAITERFHFRIKDQERRAEWLRARFGGELEDFARSQLTGKSKTWKGAFGSVSFRTTNPRVVVADQDRAVAWASVDCPDAIKTTRSVLVSNIPDSVKAQMLKVGAPDGFDIVPGGESVSIKTVSDKAASE